VAASDTLAGAVFVMPMVGGVCSLLRGGSSDEVVLNRWELDGGGGRPEGDGARSATVEVAGLGAYNGRTEDRVRGEGRSTGSILPIAR